MSEKHLGETSAVDVDGIVADDAFLDGLARGVDTSQGTDPLAAMFCQAKEFVDAPCPPAPRIDELLGSALDSSDAPTTVIPVVAESADDEGVHPGTAPVVDLAAARRPRRRVGWFGAGLTGAAAATLIIAGGGALIHGAEPGDALWGVNQAIFGNQAAVVKLATTLQEADDKKANGDVEGALKLLEKARALAQDMNAKDQKRGEVTAPTVTVTETTPVTATATPAPQTITEPAPTVTVTQAVTVAPKPKPSALNLAPGIKPTTQAVPLTAIMPTEDEAPSKGKESAHSEEPTPAKPSAVSTTPTQAVAVDNL